MKLNFMDKNLRIANSVVKEKKKERKKGKKKKRKEEGERERGRRNELIPGYFPHRVLKF